MEIAIIVLVGAICIFADEYSTNKSFRNKVRKFIKE